MKNDLSQMEKNIFALAEKKTLFAYQNPISPRFAFLFFNSHTHSLWKKIKKNFRFLSHHKERKKFAFHSSRPLYFILFFFAV